MTTLHDIPDLIRLVREVYGPDMPLLGERFATRPAVRPARRLPDKCRDEVAAAMVALANDARGGVLVLGVDCASGVAVEGVADVAKATDTVLAVARELAPVPEVEVVPCALRDGTVLAVRVEPVEAPAGCVDGRRGVARGRFALVGGQVVPGRRHAEAAAPVELTGPESLGDASELDPVEGASASDLDGVLLGRACPGAFDGATGAGVFGGPDDSLVRAGVLVPGTFHEHPTIAGLVAFGLAPSQSVPGAWVRVQVEGRTGFGRVQGPAPSVIDQLLCIVPVATGVDRALLREVLVNALAHRSYGEEARRRPVEVVRWRDRLEVVSPGEALDVHALTGTGTRRAVRNPYLLGLLRRLGLADDEGGGLSGATAHAVDRGFEAPRIHSRDGEVRVVLPVRRSDGLSVGFLAVRDPGSATTSGSRPAPAGTVPQSRAVNPLPGPGGATSPPPAARSAITQPSATQRVPAAPMLLLAPGTKPTVERQSLLSREAAVLALLRRRGRMTTREVIGALGWTRATTRLVLASLVESGELRASSPNPRSPDQSYQVARTAG